MTGRIRRLADGDETGSIQAEDGLNVSFDHSAVLAYDLDRLAVGQMVTFDIGGGAHPAAVNILSLESPQASRSAQRRLESDCLRYTGFEQSGSIRIFRFEQFVPGEERKVFLVTADLDLFARHHIGLQEGPALCLRVLTTDADAPAQDGPPSQCSLGDRDMLAHIARRPAPRKRTQPRRNPRASSAPSPPAV